MTYGFSIPFLFVPAVAVGPAGGKGVLPHKICHAARFAHGVVQTAQGGGQVVQTQLLHQHTDAAFCKASLVAAAIRVFVKLHVPRIGVAVGGFQGGSGFHSGNILWGKLAFSAFAAEPLHGLCHHGSCIVIRQPVHFRALRHGENERAEHCAVDQIHFETVGLFKLRQSTDDLPVFRPCLFRNGSCGGSIIAQHCRQLLLKRFRKHGPHRHRDSHPTHFTFPLSILPAPGTSVFRCLSGSPGIPSDISGPHGRPISQIGRSQPAA